MISKTSKARNLLEMEPEALSKVMAGAQRVARAVTRALSPDGLIIKQFNGSPAGQTVFHLHVHIIPVWENEAIGDHGEGKAEEPTLSSLAARIQKAL